MDVKYNPSYLYLTNFTGSRIIYQWPVLSECGRLARAAFVIEWVNIVQHARRSTAFGFMLLA